jgi:predicted alpha/beta-hydrolase family hydrolase
MEHSSMRAIAEGLADLGIATLRYQFPYMERGSKRTDPPEICHAAVRAAVAEAKGLAGELPLFAGGRSFGGRMTSQAQALEPLSEVRGLIFLAFPLHPGGRPAVERAAHLANVQVPMLFLQGTRDELAELTLLEPMTHALGERASLKLLEHADHSFHVLARSGRNDADVKAEALQTIVEWTTKVVRE